ncbi:MAG: hypothetical protein D6725_12115 [Planctomycetota bacterium]|nr:MAG: hypothetical protein D6725_12115 [Planctomycetota bacterium]
MCRTFRVVPVFVAAMLCIGCGKQTLPLPERVVEVPAGALPVSLAWNAATGAPVVGCTNGRVVLWENSGIPPAVRETGSTAPVTALSVLADGTVVAGTADGRLYARSPATGQERRFEPQGSSVRTIAFAPQTANVLQFVVALADGRLLFVDAQRGSEAVRSGHKGGARCASYSPDGRTFITAGDDGRLAWWSPRTRRRSAVHGGHDTAVAALQWLDGGRWLITGDWNGKLLLWNAARQTAVGDAEQPDAVAGIAVWSSREFVTGSWDGVLRLWRIETSPNRPPSIDKVAEKATGRTIECIAVDSGGPAVLVIGDDAAIRWWRWERPEGIPAAGERIDRAATAEGRRRAGR